MSDSEEEKEWEIEEICGHIRKSELINNGNDLPYDEKDLRQSTCAFAFRVKWEGFEGEDTWQSYESLKDDKKKARRYARLHGIELFSNDELMTERNNEEEEYFVDEICDHIRTTELLKRGRDVDIPFKVEKLRETECQYVFRVKWVGYEGMDTWQTYESLNDERRRARDYARLNSLELFPYKKQVFNRDDEIKRVRAIEDKFKNRESSGSSSPPTPSKENRQIDKDEEEANNRKGDEDRKIKKIKDMKMEKNTASSSRVIVYRNVEGLKIHLPNEETTPKDKSTNKSKKDSQVFKMEMRKDDSEMANMKGRKVEKSKMAKEEKKKIEVARLGEESKDSRKRLKKKEYRESDSDSDVSPIRKKKDPNGGHKSQHEKMEATRRNERFTEDKRYKSNEDRYPKNIMMKTQRKKIQDSSESSDDEGMEWEREKIINHVTVKQVRQGREIEGKEKLNWKKIGKSQLPIIFRVSFIGDGWKKKFEWQTIEELDDLPTLDKYLHTAKLDLPKNYASMMKKTKKVVDDDIFAAD